MGFLDKAKKLADQAQTKLDEVQKDFSARQDASGGASGQAGAPPVEYDQHGRPVTSAAPPAPEHKSPTIDPDTATSPTPGPAKPHGDPLLDDEPGSSSSRPPSPPAPSSGSGLSSGDPLAG